MSIGTIAEKPIDRRLARRLGVVAITSVSPNHGPASGGTEVIISGTGFFYELAPGQAPPGCFVCSVKFGSTEATRFEQREIPPFAGGGSYIVAVAPPGSGTVDVTVSGAVGTSAATPADQFTYESPTLVEGAICEKEVAAGKLPPETLECESLPNFPVSGSLGIGKLNQSVELKEGTFNGFVAVQNFVPIRAVVRGVATVKPFEATIKLLGLPAKVGLTFEQVGEVDGTLTEVEKGSGNCGTNPIADLELPCVHESASMEANVSVTSLTFLGLKIPLECKTARPVSFPLSADVLLFEEFLSPESGSHFTGTTTYPPISCGGPLGTVEGSLLSLLVSGPNNPYSLVIT